MFATGSRLAPRAVSVSASKSQGSSGTGFGNPNKLKARAPDRGDGEKASKAAKRAKRISTQRPVIPQDGPPSDARLALVRPLSGATGGARRSASLEGPLAPIFAQTSAPSSSNDAPAPNPLEEARFEERLRAVADAGRAAKEAQEEASRGVLAAEIDYSNPPSMVRAAEGFAAPSDGQLSGS